jgi:hypothetical protein
MWKKERFVQLETATFFEVVTASSSKFAEYRTCVQNIIAPAGKSLNAFVWPACQWLSCWTFSKLAAEGSRISLKVLWTFLKSLKVDLLKLHEYHWNLTTIGPAITVNNFKIEFNCTLKCSICLPFLAHSSHDVHQIYPILLQVPVNMLNTGSEYKTQSYLPAKHLKQLSGQLPNSYLAEIVQQVSESSRISLKVDWTNFWQVTGWKFSKSLKVGLPVVSE